MAGPQDQRRVFGNAFWVCISCADHLVTVEGDPDSRALMIPVGSQALTDCLDYSCFEQR